MESESTSADKVRVARREKRGETEIQKAAAAMSITADVCWVT